MGRPSGSKNKPKGCTTLSHCLEAQVRAQDEDHLERENHNVLSVINGSEEESESEYESEYDDSVLDKNYQMPIDRGEPLEDIATSTQVDKGPKKTQMDKPTTSQKAGKSTQVSTLKLSTTKTNGGRIKNKS